MTEEELNGFKVLAKSINKKTEDAFLKYDHKLIGFTIIISKTKKKLKV